MRSACECDKRLIEDLADVVDIFAMRNHNVDETSCFSRHSIEKQGIILSLQN